MDRGNPGIETIAHLREPGNGRITILFHAFEGGPKILRLWGTGSSNPHCLPSIPSILIVSPIYVPVIYCDVRG